MTKRVISEQEKFWMGDFGAQYNDRNIGADFTKGRKHLFRSALRTVGGIKNAIEFGANIGLNIRALKNLYDNNRHFITCFGIIRFAFVSRAGVR